MMQNDTPSRSRLFAAARKLFAENGYEATSTSSIARAAGTSESQLIKHYTSKAGMLDEIFQDAWENLRPSFDQRLAELSSPVERLRAIPRLMCEALARDHELRRLLLLEGRRVRKHGDQTVFSDGYRGFGEMMEQALDDMRAAGLLRDIVTPQSVRAALIGLTESLLRDQLLAEHAGHPSDFVVDDIGVLTDAVVDCVTRQGMERTGDASERYPPMKAGHS